MQCFEYILRIAALLTAMLANSLWAAELLVVEQPNCPYCEQFNREVADIYPKTDEGKLAPIVRVQLLEAWPDKYKSVKPPPVTPAFILVNQGQEVDRLLGYPGDEHFWFLIGELLSKLPQTP